MNIERFGIHLQGIRDEYADTILRWRNAHHVRSEMEHSQVIQPEEHAAWLNRIKDGNNFYFMISAEGNPWGVCNVKEIDWDRMAGEGGIFVGQEDMLGSLASAIAVIVMMDIFMGLVGLTEMRAKIKNDNKDAIEFNKRLGYQALEPGEEFSVYRVGIEEYFEKTRSIRRTLIKQYGNSAEIEVFPEDGQELFSRIEAGQSFDPEQVAADIRIQA